MTGNLGQVGTDQPPNTSVQLQPGLYAQPVVLVDQFGNPITPGLQLQATTGPAGFSLQNATPTILSWTAPSDGQIHRAIVIANQHVTGAETGGAISLIFNLPDGSAGSFALFAGGSATGQFRASGLDVCQAGAIVSVTQSTALTAGAATVWAEIWGS